MNDDLVKILDGNTFVVSDERGDIEASLTDPTGPLLVRHALPVEVGPDHQRRAAQRALHRRSAVLRDPLLPRSGHGHGLHRREALGDPPARGRRRLPRGADDPQPRREAGRPHGSPRGRLRLRRPVRGQGRARRRRAATRAGSRTAAWCSPTSARRSGGRRRSRRRRRRRSTRHGLTFTGPDRAARQLVDRPRRRHGVLGPAHAAARSACCEHARATCSATWRSWLDGAPRLECDSGRAEGDVPAQPRRPRRAAVLAPDRGRAEPAGRRPAVVHDDVRPRQHLHEPAGAAVHARARGHDAARARRMAGHRARRLPRRGSRAGSCTRCATAR